MSNFLTASIGRKFIMSISGLFLLMFICVHLGINLLLLFDDSGELFNLGAHFMATNPLIKIMEPVLGLGFVVHIIWSFLISFQNYKARPVGYDKSNAAYSSTWASRNMLVLGGLVLVFLVMHIIQFFIPVKTGGLESVNIDGVEMHNTYLLVSELFKSSVLFSVLYMIGGALLGFHLAHGFWSAFQTIGMSNKNWLKRLQCIGKIYAIVVAVGFAIIPLYFLIKF
ncbi:succinate dehydrogenase cytochrome b subunit [Mangrovibacterium sp.]|uniref:succinate dehydrogenase cytochrome b subunit n=1 Tax=Mangrovibacterium sp. TaxID=1961364 RepID=UPI003569D38B